jgi:hypothetical protein
VSTTTRRYATGACRQRAYKARQLTGADAVETWPNLELSDPELEEQRWRAIDEALALRRLRERRTADGTATVRS